ncbi:MAG: hypothetical protein PHW09_06600 [Desulfovibrio desulfuricans]|nr:hypothetical protein [Desulfovibrio desulfuricans]
MTQKLTQAQKDRFNRLTAQLRECHQAGDFESAKLFAYDIRSLAQSTGDKARWLYALNILSETALMAGKVNYAIQLLNNSVQTSNGTTRLRVEAYCLLAIAYLRSGEIESARNSAVNGINTIKNITSKFSRQNFYKNFIERIEEEAILAGARLENTPHFDVDIVQADAIKILSESESQLLTRIGSALPDRSVNLFHTFRDTTLLQIPHQERLCLQPPPGEIPTLSIGKRAMAALKHICWATLCDKNDELYKAWSEGLALVYDKKLIAGAIVAAFSGANIGSSVLAASTAAYIFKFTCRTFCEAFAPKSIMKREYKKYPNS